MSHYMVSVILKIISPLPTKIANKKREETTIHYRNGAAIQSQRPEKGHKK